MDLVEDCGADSLDLVEIVVQIRQLDIEVPDVTVTELKLTMSIT